MFCSRLEAKLSTYKSIEDINRGDRRNSQHCNRPLSLRIMKTTALVLSSLAIAQAYVPSPSSRAHHGLNYKTHEYEYGLSDDRVRTLTSDDRVSALKVLETDVFVEKRSVSWRYVIDC